MQGAAAVAEAAAVAAAHNAHAVQAATEAMLAAGFGHFDAGGGLGGVPGEDELDEDDLAAGELAGMAPPSLASQLALATQHTATAASSLAALPSQAFFASLRVGEGVDALDLIGQPQWRHAVILDCRPEENAFLIRWAGWDPKWDEHVHSLRLAPAHSKVLGDTGPEDSGEKNVTMMLGAEWAAMRRQWPQLLADVDIRIEGRPPWSILRQTESQEPAAAIHAAAVTTAAVTATSPQPPRHRGPPTPSLHAPPSRHAASATPPSYAYAFAPRSSEFRSLDDDDDEDDDGFVSASTAFALGSSASAIAAPATPIAAASPPRRQRRGPVQHAHECMLRVRCPRIFKFERDARSFFTGAEADSFATQDSPVRAGLQHDRDGAGDEGDFKADDADFDEAGSPMLLKGSRTAPASTVATALASDDPAAATAAAEQKKSLGGSLKLPLSSTSKGRQSLPPSSSNAHQRLEHPSAVLVASAITTTGPPPSARLAKSSSTTVLRSGAQTARTSGGGGSATLSRQSSVSSLSSSPVAAASKAVRKSAGAAAAPASASLTRSGSTPSSAPNSAQRRLFGTAAAAASSGTRARPTGSPAAGSRSQTPNTSAPATPRLKPAVSGVTASPRGSPLGPRRSGESLLSPSSASPRGSPPSAAARRGAARPTSAAASAPPAQRRSSGAAASPSPPAAAASSLSLSSPSPLLTPLEPSIGGAEVEEESDNIAAGAAVASPASEPAAHVLSSSTSLTAAALGSPSAVLFPKTTSSLEECKEQTPSIADPFLSPDSASRSPPPPPPRKLLVLPLSSTKALRAFCEYVYSDVITDTALGQSSLQARQTATSATSKPAAKLRRNLAEDPTWSEDEDDVKEHATSNGTATDAAATSACSSASGAMSVLDLLELACLASSLHDGRLMCLASLHLQRALSVDNIMPLLRVLDLCGALEHRVKADQQRQGALSVHLSGSLAPLKNEPTAASGGKGAAAAPVSSAGCVPSGPIPAVMLAPDTPSRFLRSGALSLCGPSPHDLDLLSRVVMDYLLTNWQSVFSSGDNMRALHAMPFQTFSMLVSLKNAAPGTVAGGGGGGGTGAEGAEQGGLVVPRPYQFASPLEKATFAQAQVNAALIAAGIQPTPAHNLFAQAHLLGGGLGLPFLPPGGVVGPPGSPSHNALVQLIASPSIALPAAGLLKAMKALYESRSESSCDVKLVIEDDASDAFRSPVAAPAAGAIPPCKIVATLWAHKVVLAFGSDYFRTYFGAGRGAQGSASGLLSGWARDSSGAGGGTDDDDGVTVLRFPSTSFTPASLQALLRFIYTGSTGGLDFATALHVLNAHPNAFFGLRQWPAPVGGAPLGLATTYTPPASFSCDLEKTCVNLLHAALNAGGAAGSGGGGSSSNGMLAPSAVEVLHLIQSAYLHGAPTRALFERGCSLLDWPQLNALMQAVQTQQKAAVAGADARSPSARRARRSRAALYPVRRASEHSRRDDTDDGDHSEDDDETEDDELASDASDDSTERSSFGAWARPSGGGSCSGSGALAGALDMDFIAAVIAEKARAVAAAAVAAASHKATR